MFVKMSDNLKQMLEQLNPAQYAQVMQMFKHYENEYLRLKQEMFPADVAEVTHDLIQESVDKSVKDTDYTISCSKGCSFCCFQKVDITDDEAALIHNYTKSEGIEIDYNTLEKQVVSELEDYKALPAIVRRCVFLNKDGECNIYQHRPNACRKLVAITDPSNCDTINNKGAEVGRLGNIEAEIIDAATGHATTQGVMAEMLLKLKN